MFDIGWSEMFLIGVVALIVVGPKDLPALFRTAGNFMGKARGMAREFQRSMEQAANESGMSDVSESLKALDRNINSASGSARKFAQSMTGTGGGFAGDGPAAAAAPKIEPVPAPAPTEPVASVAEPAAAAPREAGSGPAAG